MKKSIDEFHRGFVGGERHAVSAILKAIKDAPIPAYAKVRQMILLNSVCREELAIDLKELEANGK